MSKPNQLRFTSGVHHVGLTVPDLAEAKAFFVDTLAFDVVGGNEDYPAVFVSDGETMITLWQSDVSSRVRRFDRRANVGLHHLALTVRKAGSLDALHALLRNTRGVLVEFAPELLGDGPARHMMCLIPGGIRVEFITPATSAIPAGPSEP